MKKIIIFSTVFFLLFASKVYSAEPLKLPDALKTLSYEQAVKTSSTSKKPVIVFFWADWCSACRYVIENVFSVEKLQNEINNNFLLVSINVEEKDNKDLIKKYSVRSLPTIMFLTEKEDVALYIPGAPTEEIMYDIINFIKNKTYLDMDFDTYYSNKTKQ